MENYIKGEITITAAQLAKTSGELKEGLLQIVWRFFVSRGFSCFTLLVLAAIRRFDIGVDSGVDHRDVPADNAACDS